MNKIILIGHVGKDPDISDVNSNKVARFSFATSKTYKNKQGEKKTDTTWHNVVVWGKQAEIVQKYIKKGQQLMIDGEQSNRSYEKDGQTRYISEVICNSFEFLGVKPESAKQSETNQTAKESEDTDDLPF